MGINKFLILVVVFTVVFLVIDKEQTVQKVQKVEKPKVSFYDSIMYDITQKNVNQIVKSKQADIYDKREELFDATIVAKSEKNSYDTNIVSGKTIIKKGDKVHLIGSVNLQLTDGTNVKTEELFYNTKTKIAKNSIDFVAIRDNDTFHGNTLYLDAINEELSAKQTKFRMKVKND
ncbi:MAG: hypothetical protein WBG69_10880 [Arcobacteraceae bacterium]